MNPQLNPTPARPRDQASTGVESMEDARRTMYRTQVLAAAETEFARSGYSDTKMTAIAKTAGLSLATVYKHFAGKTEIWDALHADRMGAMLDDVDRAATRPGRVVDRMISGVAEVARFLADHDAYLDMNLTTGASWAKGSSCGAGTQKTVWTAGQDQLIAAAEVAAARGEIPPLRPRITAWLMISALRVWLADWVDAGRDRSAEDVVTEFEVHLRRTLRPS